MIPLSLIINKPYTVISCPQQHSSYELVLNEVNYHESFIVLNVSVSKEKYSCS